MGRLLQIGIRPESGGPIGLPKPSVPEARIGASGVAGDFNRYRHQELSDDPDNAVMLIPIETLRALAREGWPVNAGDLGENLTTEGIPYEAMGPGRRLRVGEVQLQISKPCVPCTNLYSLPYVGTARGPEFVKTTLGRRGWYARVLRPGRVRVGDPVDLLEGPPSSGT